MAADPHDPADPKGLIREAYRIDGITAAECRTIFLDWALSVPGPAGGGEEPVALIGALIARYGTASPDHPMTQTLHAGLAPQPQPRRRGGRAGRGLA